MDNICCWEQSLIMFLSFSFAASAIYCLNDIIDVEDVRKHPVKRNRPIAKGDVSIIRAYIVSGILCCLSLAFPLLAGGDKHLYLIGIIAAYIVMNISYSLKLKQFGIIDVMIIAIGFVLRIVCGGVACDIPLSPWIVSLAFLLTLLLAFAKRRDDIVILNEQGVQMRKNVKAYNLAYLDLVLGMLTAVILVCYIMYTVSPDVIARTGSNYVYLSSIFVIGGLLRYLQLTIVVKKSGDPTDVFLHDGFLQVMIVLWVLTFIFFLYL